MSALIEGAPPSLSYALRRRVRIQAVQWNGNNLPAVAMLMGYHLAPGGVDFNSASFGPDDVQLSEFVRRGDTIQLFACRRGVRFELVPGEWVVRDLAGGITIMSDRSFQVFCKPGTPS